MSVVALVSLAAVVVGSGGCVLCYLASPNQTLMAKRPRGLPWVLAGVACLVVALGLCLAVLGPATAIYCVSVIAMAWFSALPFLGLWARRRRETR